MADVEAANSTAGEVRGTSLSADTGVQHFLPWAGKQSLESKRSFLPLVEAVGLAGEVAAVGPTNQPHPAADVEGGEGAAAFVTLQADRHPPC